jgi:DUF2889 family protein
VPDPTPDPTPDPSPTFADLRSTIGAEEPPLHRRTIEMNVFEREGYHVVIGTLHDQRPWATGVLGPRHLHQMELGIVVRRSDLVIVDAQANMHTFPHAECPTIESSFTDLIGLSVSRGYSSAVQARFGRERGCSHLEFLARALGPVVIQAITSSASMRIEKENGSSDTASGAESGTASVGGRAEPVLAWMTNTCHVWAEDGAGMQKVAAGWRPGLVPEYPAPSVVEIMRRRDQAK